MASFNRFSLMFAHRLRGQFDGLRHCTRSPRIISASAASIATAYRCNSDTYVNLGQYRGIVDASPSQPPDALHPVTVSRNGLALSPSNTSLKGDPIPTSPAMASAVAWLSGHH